MPLLYPLANGTSSSAKVLGACVDECCPNLVIAGLPGGIDILAQGQLEADKVLEDRGDSAPPTARLKAAQVNSVNLDRPVVGVIETAEQLGERGLAGAVLTDDRQRGADLHGEVQPGEDRAPTARVGE